jgi:biopolymer transport protein ExbB/TolQ
MAASWLYQALTEGGTGMQFGLLEMDGPIYGPIGLLAIWYIILGVLVMVYMFISMLKRYSHIRRWLRSLVEPILAQIRKGEWEPSALISPDTKDPQLSVCAAALRQELSGPGPIAIIEALNKTIDLLGQHLERMIYYSRLLGWSICLIGFIGALSHLLRALRAYAYLKGVPLGALAAAASEAIWLFVFALFIGLGCLAGSYFSKSRLSSLNQEVSDRILKAAEERTAQDLKIEKV